MKSNKKIMKKPKELKELAILGQQNKKPSVMRQ